MIQFSGCQSSKRRNAADLFSGENLVAWCIVPFDASDRTPEQRAVMLDELGISQLAYDYRDEHIPSFKEDIQVVLDFGYDFHAT